MGQTGRGTRDGLYPVLREGLYLHLMPEDSMLYMDDKQYTSVALNRTADEVLELCDGSHTVREIGLLMAHRHHEQPERARQLIDQFLDQALERRHIDLHMQPGGPYGRVCGNRYYWVPRLINLELTRKCPLRCRHCYAEAGLPQENELTTEEWLSILHNLAAMGSMACLLSGGEPTIHPGFPTILEVASDHFATVSLLSSGFSVDKPMVEHIAWIAQRTNLGVQISLDGPRDAHNQIRGHPQAFDRAVAACDSLAREGIPITIVMCVTPETQGQIEDVVRIARDHGATSFRLGQVYPIGRAEGAGLDIGIDTWHQVMDSYLELSREYDTSSFFLRRPAQVIDFGIDPAHHMNCGAGYAQIAILSNGDVTPCISFSHVMGNVRRQPYEQIFASEIPWFFKRFRAPSPSVCGTCEQYTFCDGCVMRGEIFSRGVTGCTWRPLAQGRFG